MVAYTTGRTVVGGVSNDAASAILDRAHGKPTATVLASVGTLAEVIAAADALPPPRLP